MTSQNDDLQTSVTAWLSGLKRKESDATEQLWNRYFNELVQLAREKLGDGRRRVDDEEDVAASVLKSLYLRADRFQKLEDRHDLWILLLTMTQRKCVDRIRYNLAQKRSGARTVGERELRAEMSDLKITKLDDLVSRMPDPETVVTMQEEFGRLLQLLRNEELRQIARWRMDGDSTEDIAGRIGLTSRSVRRKLELIRDTWLAELQP